jgi:UDPglucose--hexose-1-phosphate uridylyltransferase
MTQRRYDPLADRWVVLSTGRLSRPWRGAVDAPATAVLPTHDPGCYLCPGNTRASGAVNPDYRGPWAFDNDYPALTTGLDPVPAPDANSLFRSLPVRGRCRVICYGPRHDRGLGDLDADARLAVVKLWREEWMSLAREHAWVQVFENRGEMMGASSPHPHGQVWATAWLPTLPATEDGRQAAFFAEHGRRMLDDYVAAELERGERIVCANAQWVALVPYWAVWPFETMLVSRTGAHSFADVDDDAARALAELLGDLVPRYDRLFGVPFPYSMGWHGRDAAHWTLHAHFLPPLLRSATVRKHMVGFELLAEAQRDLTPEEAAQRLREA